MCAFAKEYGHTQAIVRCTHKQCKVYTMHTYIYGCVDVCMCVCVLSMDVFMYVYAYVYSCMYMHVYTCMHAHTFICEYIHVYTLPCTHVCDLYASIHVCCLKGFLLNIGGCMGLVLGLELRLTIVRHIPPLQVCGSLVLFCFDMFFHMLALHFVHVGCISLSGLVVEFASWMLDV